MKITSIDQLNDWKRNPRNITDKAFKGLGRSLEEFGDLSGITFNVRNKSLVTGHQRLRALREKYNGQLRIEDNIIITPTGEKFPIRIVDWDDKRHAAANIAANSRRISGDFTEGLASLLEELKVDLPELFPDLNFDELRFDIWKIYPTSVNDPTEVWRGMPKFLQEDILGKANAIIVWFAKPEDREEFGRLIGQKITEKTKSIWFPKQNTRRSDRSKAYISTDA